MGSIEVEINKANQVMLELFVVIRRLQPVEFTPQLLWTHILEEVDTT